MLRLQGGEAKHNVDVQASDCHAEDNGCVPFVLQGLMGSSFQLGTTSDFSTRRLHLMVTKDFLHRRRSSVV